MVGTQQQSLGGQCWAMAAVVPGLPEKGVLLSPGKVLQEGGSNKAVCKGGKRYALQAKCSGSAPVPSHPFTATAVGTDAGKWGWGRARNIYNSLCSYFAGQQHLPIAQEPYPPYAAPCIGECYTISQNACTTSSPCLAHSRKPILQAQPCPSPDDTHCYNCP